MHFFTHFLVMMVSSTVVCAQETGRAGAWSYLEECMWIDPLRMRM